MNIFREIKWRWQRSKRGWAECDVWNLDAYLCSILAGALKNMEEDTNGSPCLGDSPPESCKGCSCNEQWHKELRDAAKMFSDLVEKPWHDEDPTQALDREQQAQDAALDWLRKRFWHLWD